MRGLFCLGSGEAWLRLRFNPADTPADAGFLKLPAYPSE